MNTAEEYRQQLQVNYYERMEQCARLVVARQYNPLQFIERFGKEGIDLCRALQSQGSAKIIVFPQRRTDGLEALVA